MARGDDDLRLVRVGDQVHGTAHALEDLAWDHVVGKIPVRAYLEGLEMLVSGGFLLAELVHLLPEWRRLRVRRGSYRMIRCCRMSRLRGPR